MGKLTSDQQKWLVPYYYHQRLDHHHHYHQVLSILLPVAWIRAASVFGFFFTSGVINMSLSIEAI